MSPTSERHQRPFRARATSTGNIGPVEEIQKMSICGPTVSICIRVQDLQDVCLKHMLREQQHLLQQLHHITSGFDPAAGKDIAQAPVDASEAPHSLEST